MTLRWRIAAQQKSRQVTVACRSEPKAIQVGTPRVARRDKVDVYVALVGCVVDASDLLDATVSSEVLLPLALGRKISICNA
jgi:hypothetical protein